jgi:hypothetical protein
VHIEAGRSIGKLCSQGCSKGSNDINKLALHNKRSNLHVAKAHLGRTPIAL